MTTATDVELDQTTLEDLQPPCSFWDLDQQCQQPAAWIGRFVMTCDHGRAVEFACHHHLDLLDIGDDWGCVICNADSRLVSVERL